MIEKLKKTLDILDILDIQNSKKFISKDFNDINNILDLDIKEYIVSLKENDNSNFSKEEQEIIFDIIFKIEKLESKILPKANLINSFSDSLS